MIEKRVLALPNDGYCIHCVILLETRVGREGSGGAGVRKKKRRSRIYRLLSPVLLLIL